MNRMKIYLMGLVDEGSEQGKAFIWDESLHATTTNHLMTCIWMYILCHHEGQKKLRMTLDNCSVNKCYMLIAFIVSLVIFGFFDEIDLCWLVVGHTKFSPDRMFGLISSALRTSDVTTKQGWSELVSKQTGNHFLGIVVQTIIDFTSMLECHFRTNNFLSLDGVTRGPIKIKSLQGIRVQRTMSDISILALQRHLLADERALNNHVSTGSVPSPLQSRLQTIFTDAELKVAKEKPMKPPVRIDVLKKNSNAFSGEISYPTLGDYWWELRKDGISSNLLKDLWRADGLIISIEST